MQNRPFRVSVVIPVYNEEKYLKACLTSLLKQSSKADEIIIINNNSTDNTIRIAKQFPVKIVNEKKQGTTLARNRGFNEARFEIIARTDADTILPANWIKRIKDSFSDDSVVAISGPASFYDLPSIFKRKWTKRTSVKFITSYNSIVKQILKHDCLFGPNFAVRRSAWNYVKDSVCLDDNKVHEDLDLAIHLSPLGEIKFIKSMAVSTSMRRWKKPEAYFNYLYRGIKSIQVHKKPAIRLRSTQLVKKLFNKTFFTDELPTDLK